MPAPALERAEERPVPSKRQALDGDLLASPKEQASSNERPEAQKDAPEPNESELQVAGLGGGIPWRELFRRHGIVLGISALAALAAVASFFVVPIERDAPATPIAASTTPSAVVPAAAPPAALPSTSSAVLTAPSAEARPAPPAASMVAAAPPPPAPPVVVPSPPPPRVPAAADVVVAPPAQTSRPSAAIAPTPPPVEPALPLAPSVPSAAPVPSSAASAQPAGDGFLNINSLPASLIVLDGKPIGSTPKVHVQVTAGAHTVVFTNSDLGVMKEIAVTVGAGETKLASAKLRDEAPAQ